MSDASEPRPRGNAWAGIVWPLLWGAAACVGIYALLLRGPLNLPLLQRYLAGHPIAYATTAMFCVGMAALVQRWFDLMGEVASLRGTKLAAAPRGGQPVEDCRTLLKALDELPGRSSDNSLAHRLRAILTNVRRKGTAEGLEEELKYQSEMDSIRQQESYALVWLVIWATPMLGFLGTVVGITKALGDLDFGQMATAMNTAMDGLLKGLYVAFDTTALALTLSIVLMFVRFLVERVESQLASRVDSLAEEQLVGRFQMLGGARDPQVAAVQRMGQAVVESSERLVQRQAELWQATIDAAHDHWSRLTEAAQDGWQDSLRGAMAGTLDEHSRQMAAILAAADDQARQQWRELDVRLAKTGDRLDRQQSELVRLGELMTRALTAVGDVVSLEQALNRNLEALAGASNFEDTVMSLSAAIHLLNTRLGGDLRRPRPKSGERDSSERAA